MEFKGTKGKWLYTPHMGDYDVRVDDGTKYHRMITICEVVFNPQRPTEAEANAQLIAAAPELLDALSEAANFIREIDINVNHEEGLANTMMNALVRLEYFDMVLSKALGKEADDE